MKKFLTTAVLATAFMAAPAMAECVSDINKADAIIQSYQLDPATQSEAVQLTSKAKTQKMEGEFESCNTTTRQLKALLGYE